MCSTKITKVPRHQNLQPHSGELGQSRQGMPIRLIRLPLSTKGDCHKLRRIPTAPRDVELGSSLRRLGSTVHAESLCTGCGFIAGSQFSGAGFGNLRPKARPGPRASDPLVFPVHLLSGKADQREHQFLKKHHLPTAFYTLTSSYSLFRQC